REIGCGLPVRHGRGLESEPALGPMGRAAPCADTVAPVGKLVEQSGLPHPWLPDHRDRLTMPGPGLLQRLLQDRELGLPSHEPGESPPYRGLQTLPDGTRPHELEDLDR